MAYCQRCGNCCKIPEAVYLNLEDVQRLTKFHGGTRAVRQFITFHKGRWKLKRVQPCQYLSYDNQCRIYAIRPRACRNFPLTDEYGDVEILDMPYCQIKQNLPHHGLYQVIKQ